MVRRVQKKGWSVTLAASVLGFSRISYYKIQHTIETRGLMGLMPKKRGPKHATKITDAVLAFIDESLEKTPGLSSPKLKTLLATELGLDVHKRTIERALQRKKKLQRKTPDGPRGKP
ncbi:MAG: helix-turn-helix domain containing protein [Candidatus Helarchaeota archaeon]|nr:helix-turn-helix domain containing protein [Candidatus Helarchaeota archaeon]